MFSPEFDLRICVHLRESEGVVFQALLAVSPLALFREQYPSMTWGPYNGLQASDGTLWMRGRRACSAARFASFRTAMPEIPRKQRHQNELISHEAAS